MCVYCLAVLERLSGRCNGKHRAINKNKNKEVYPNSVLHLTWCTCEVRQTQMFILSTKGIYKPLFICPSCDQRFAYLVC